MNWERREAVVYIHPATLKQDQAYIERLAIHELLHLVTAPIMEEHTLQIHYLHTERKKEYKERMRRLEEQQVEQLSHVLYSLK